MKSEMGLKEWLSLLVLSIIWGGSFFFIEIALTGFSPFTIVFMRVFFGALIVLFFLWIRKMQLPSDPRIWLRFLVMGVLNNAIPFSCITWGQKSITGGLASLLNAATPFFTVIAAHFLTRDEKITLRKFFGIIFGFSGVFILLGSGSVGGDNSLPGMLAVLTAALSYAFAGVWGRQFKDLGIDPGVTAAGQLLCSSAVLLPFAVLIDRPWNIPVPGMEAWGAVLGLAVLSTAAAYLLYFRILASSGATNVLLVTFLVPVSAIILVVLFLGEKVYPRHFFGMGIIAAGLAVIDGRIFRTFFKDHSKAGKDRF